MRLKIANENEYEDRSLHNLFQSLLEENYYDAVVFFREHLVAIIYDKEKRVYEYSLLKLTKDCNSYIEVESDELLKVSHECHKYITHMLVHQIFNKFYEIKGDFPMGELEIQFVEDISSFIFIDE